MALGAGGPAGAGMGAKDLTGFGGQQGEARREAMQTGSGNLSGRGDGGCCVPPPRKKSFGKKVGHASLVHARQRRQA